MDLEIHVDRQVCTGAGQCIRQAPGVFDFDRSGISVVINPDGDPIERIVRAVTACPVDAISLRANSAVLTAQDLRMWNADVDTDHPLVAALATLGEDHHAMLQALGTLTELSAAQIDDLFALIADHLTHEQQVFAQFEALLSPAIIDTFREAHTAIEDLLARQMNPDARQAMSDDAWTELETVLTRRVAAEEAVLFASALSALSNAAAS